MKQALFITIALLLAAPADAARIYSEDGKTWMGVFTGRAKVAEPGDAQAQKAAAEAADKKARDAARLQCSLFGKNATLVCTDTIEVVSKGSNAEKTRFGVQVRILLTTIRR